ncbi:polysaccharide biosynthesis protein [Azospirillum sp. TSH100]|uniref:oligosaccharide flippase family protein n=1 Tax=Azospirillum sp. TSH100 TaxID=652764 RepID=UPI000D60C044|nr:oligosaccharide flippase family protein [Azospirillum sp. TSH100]PWC89388.1 polysaccharide biosynthesis protein [Azospirillum sp. TSH100]QCG90255.1 polysaccharide biosynthesis protein [Azospirillum sp. TSH100]
MLKGLIGRKAATWRTGFARDGIATVLVTAATMGLGLLTGILVARTIGPDGRGALAAVLTTVQLLGWLFGMGCGKAVTYALSRDHAAGGRLLGTWTLILLPVAVLAIGIGYLLLPTLLAAQPTETLALARLYLPMIAMALLSELMLGLILGDQDFRSFNALTFIQPAGVAILYALLWAAGRFTVESAVIVQATMSTLVLAVAATLLVRRHGIGRPDLVLGRQTAWYALRTHGDVVGGVITQRLDLLIIPAVLPAAQVGLYALATSLSWLIVSLSGALATVVMPAAARRGRSGRELVLNSLQATFAIGGLLGGGLFVFADIAIRLVYGPPFADSALPLRLLLPGAVLYAAASILLNGLYAENRPFTATLANLLGMGVTLGGLLLFLRSGGILAAAIVSTVAYTLVFATAATLYRRATGLPWRVFIPDPAMLAALPRRLFDKPSPVAATPASTLAGPVGK